MAITQEQFDAAVLEVTSGPNWAIVKQGLANDVYQTQATVFDTAQDWGQVMELKGFARGLAYVMNLRETITRAKEIADANIRL